MKNGNPVLSIGLPVYNGERYIRCSLESLLSQSFRDFELTICDNASTDETSRICMDYVHRDSRIRYHRNEKNLGASANFNKTFELSRGRYFKWASYDDVCAPDFLLRCIEALDNDESAVLAYTGTTEIDENGNAIGDFGWKLNFGSEKPSERFRELLVGHSACYEVFGVIRSDVVRKTKLIGPYIGSDRKLLSELALRGRFVEIPQSLFMRRKHDRTSWDTMARNPTELAKWFDTSVNRRVVAAKCRLFVEYTRVITASPIDVLEKMRCLKILMRWLKINRCHIQDELLRAAKVTIGWPIRRLS
jgi:glycosyltransferase involved in cell wall biosynthesis